MYTAEKPKMHAWNKANLQIFRQINAVLSPTVLLLLILVT